MYEIVLFIHSWFRWILLLILIFIIFRAVIGVSRNTIFMNFDDKVSLILVSLFHLQLLLGLILYALASISATSLISSADASNFSTLLKSHNWYIYLRIISSEA